MKWIIIAMGLAWFSASASANQLNQTKIVAKTVYSEQNAREFQGSHILVNLIIPPSQGALTIEVSNNTGLSFGSFNFNLSILGGSGSLQFANLAPTVTARRIINLPTLRELKIEKIIAFNKQADEIFPRTIVQYVYPKNMKKSDFVSRR